jgi:hypothetical protein
MSVPNGLSKDEGLRKQETIKKTRKTVAYDHSHNTLSSMITGSQNNQAFFSGQSPATPQITSIPQNDQQPMSWNERYKIYEINLKHPS